MHKFHQKIHQRRIASCRVLFLPVSPVLQRRRASAEFPHRSLPQTSLPVPAIRRRSTVTQTDNKKVPGKKIATLSNAKNVT